jgi:flavin-dependent dehydrogenase
VLVIGAGPAGAASAWSAALAGARVLLVERCGWPRRKVCGSCINPAGVRVLGRMGVLELEPGAPLARLTGVRLRAPGGLDAVLEVDAGVAVERAALDAALVAAAQRAGAVFSPGTSARVIAREGRGWRVAVGGGEVVASVVISCDGLTGSSVAAIADEHDLGAIVDPASGMGAGAIIPPGRGGPWERVVGPGEVAMHMGDEGYVGVVRLGDGGIDLAAALDPGAVRAARGPAPVMARILEGCGVCGAGALLHGESVQGTGILSRRRRRLGTLGLMLAGDAAGYVEPFTGEGITWALVQGERAGGLAARAAGDGTAWEDVERDWSGWVEREIEPRRRACRGVQWALRRRAARRWAFGALGTSSLARRAAGGFIRHTWRAYASQGAGERTACAS